MNRRAILASLSLANLWYVRVWDELLTFRPGDSYIMTHPPLAAEYLAAVVNVLLLAAVFLGLSVAASRFGGAKVRAIGEMLFVAALAVPLNGFREILSRQIPYLKSPLFSLIGVKGVWLLAGVLAIAGAAAVLLWHRALARGVLAGLVVLSPFCVVTFGQALWRAAHYDNAAYRSKPAAPMQAQASSRRVIWFIADEWDYRLTFVDRDPALSLPAIDRLAAETLAASNAFPPGAGTPESIPSYYSRHLYSPVVMTDTARLWITDKKSGRRELWGQQTSVFDLAREAGYNTALIEWYHPTCRVLGGLNLCEWWPLARQFNSMGETLPEILPRQTRSLFETSLFSPFGQSLSAELHAGITQKMIERSREMLADARYGFTVIHLPIPHNPFVWDRRTGAYTLRNKQITGYVDHLELLDRTIADLRLRMEQAGVWDSTTVLWTSDHEYREARAIDGKYEYRIPWMLKLAGQTGGMALADRFNAVTTADLLLAVLRGEIRDAAGAAAWLRSHPGE